MARVVGLPDLQQRVPLAIILALGLTQIVGYGTLYYSFSILAPEMAADLGWSVDGVFGIFSGSLLVSGVIAPVIGRWIDRFGAALLMTAGSAAAAVTLVLCALSWSPMTFTASLILLEIASGLVLYQSAFAVLVQVRPQIATRSITYLTLMAGFASTLFWPLTSSLHAHLTWRQIYFAFAVLNLVICLPLHAWLMRNRKAYSDDADHDAPARVIGTLPPARRRSGFVLASVAFALQGFTLSAVLVHMVPLLTAVGLGGAAVLVSTLFGPSQFLSRFVNMVLGRDLTPPALATLSAAFIVAAVVLLEVSSGSVPGAIAFAICLGFGSGINSIAQGSLPLWLFGSDGYGALTGRMAALRLIAGAAAPFVFATMMQGVGVKFALTVNAALGMIGVAAFVALWLGGRRDQQRLQA